MRITRNTRWNTICVAAEGCRVLRQTMTNESAFQRNESKEETREHEEGSVRAVTYAFRLVKSHNDEMPNHELYATTNSLVANHDYVTPTYNVFRPVP